MTGVGEAPVQDLTRISRLKGGSPWLDTAGWASQRKEQQWTDQVLQVWAVRIYLGASQCLAGRAASSEACRTHSCGFATKSYPVFGDQGQVLTKKCG